MKKNLLTLLLLLPIIISAQDFIVPQSFKYLKEIVVDANWDIRAFVGQGSVETTKDDTKSIREFYKWDELVAVAWVKISPQQEKKILLCFNPGMSMDPTYLFFEAQGDTFIKLEEVVGQQIYIPGSGRVYVSGHANDMFQKHEKYEWDDHKLIKVDQPYYYVGIETKTIAPITLYRDKELQNTLASLPKGAPIEIVAASLVEGNYHFLIKTSFGLLGWWPLDHYFSQKVKNLNYQGD